MRAALYFVVLFSYQTPVLNRPKDSHTFATFVETTADGTYVNEFTISWLPRRLDDPAEDIRTLGPAEPGRNFSRGESLAQGRRDNRRPRRWGPLRVSPEFFARARRRYDELNAGGILYKVLDGGTRPRAVNCIHAVSDASGVLLETGLHRGDAATEDVLVHFMDGTGERDFVGYPAVDERLAERLGIGDVPHAPRLPRRNAGDGRLWWQPYPPRGE